MADRFPLIVNSATKKIEELVAGDNLNLSSNGVIANNTLGTAGQYLKTNGTTVVWDNPGDVYLTATQTITNKTFNSCTLSGSTNIFSNIPNTALVNSTINVNGVAIPLGGSVTTPDNNTTYSVSAVDGASASEKVIRLTSGGNFGSGVNDDVTFVAGNNVTLTRTNDAITINSSFVDTDTVTRLQSAVGGSLVSGDVTIAAGGSSTVSQSGSVITISSSFTDTITRLRAGTGQTLASGDFTFLASGASSIAQDGGNITISSINTVTRVRGATTGTFNSGDITIVGSGASTVSQDGTTITVNSIDTNTVTRLRGTTGGTFNSGDITITATGAATVSQVGNTINVSATDTNTTYDIDASGGLVLSGTNFSIRNSNNFTDSKVIKWDNSNKQFVNSIITDDGSTVTIGGDFIVSGTTTTLNTQTLIVADNEIELRRGNNLVGSDGGLRLNRTTNSSGVAQTYTALQWFESGGFWRVTDGSVSRRLVTESETQILTNKTLTSPILTSPTLGIATATTINGLDITTTSSGVLTIDNSKTLRTNNTVTFSGTDGSTVAFRNGGSIAYTSDTLATFATTTSTQLRGVISDSTGVGVLVFNQNPNFTDSIGTQSTSFSLFNSTATSISAFGAATTITIGANGTGTTTIRTGLTVNKSVTLGQIVGDTLTVNSTVDFVNADITIRGTSVNPIRVGRGGNSIASNTRVGFSALQNNTSGSQNTAFGFEAALTLNAGAASTAIGHRALRNAGVGTSNTAVGRDAILNLLSGSRNTAVGVSALNENTIGNANVCIGHFAGYNCLGTGNVLIGPADDENSTNATYQPPSVSGDRQLVIGSGTGTWLRGDNNFDLTALQNFNVGGNLVVTGNLTINGTTTTINSATLSVDDKTIEMGAVANTTFVATVVNGSANITGVTPTTNLIPGMVVSITTGGISVPAGTFIVSITGNAAVLSEVVTGSSGSATFNAVGPSDTSADGGGIVLRGTTNKSITWSDTTDAWTSTEHFDLATGKQYRLGNVLIASSSQIGPSTGSFSLGAGVTASSLTSVGTLTSLGISGAISSSFSTVGSAALTLTNDAATALANNTFNVAKTVKGGIHFGNAAGTGGAARQAAITFRGNSTDEAQAGIYVINNSTIGTAMTLCTTDNYTTGPQQAITIANTGDVTINKGNIIIGTSGKGIDFSATADAAGMTSELLDDYEEGTFTPTVTTAGYTISSSAAAYTKIGRQVTIHVRVNFSAVGTSNSTVAFSGLPFSSSGLSHFVGVTRETTNNGEIYVAQVNISSSNFSFNSYNGVANGSTAIIATGENYDTTITYLTD
jgi:hypothetical protein